MTAFDIFGVSPQTFQESDVTNLKEWATKTPPEVKKRRAILEEARGHEQGLEGTLTEVNALGERATRVENQQLVAAMDEAISTGKDCDARSLAASWRTAHDESTIWQETANLLRFKRIPAARLRRLEAALALRKIEAVEAGVLANLSHAETIAKLVTAGVFRADNRVALINEETERLRAAAKECDRQVTLAEDALRSERARQLTAENARMIKGTLSRAEVASAIPSY
jgi:hypothetical protein